MFRFSSPKLLAKDLYLRPPLRRDKREWLQLRYASLEHLQNWEPDYGKEFASSASFNLYFRHIKNLLADKRGEGWLIFNSSDNAMIGSITLSNMRFGSVQAADIGYWVGAGYAGHGKMSEALPLVLSRVFEHYNLRRLNAASLPENKPSRHILKKFGFELEGTARQYLHINGAYRDHHIYALLAETYFTD